MFTSLLFPIFLMVAATFYFLLPGKYRPAFLLIISWIFCATISIHSLIILILISIFTFFAGKWIHAGVQKTGKSVSKHRMILSVSACIFILATYKYLPYLSQNLKFIPDAADDVLNNLIIPVGLSFYMFQAISYLADIYLQKCPVETDFIKYSLYLGYFAKFISGPIERESSFSDQLDTLDSVRFLHRGRLSLSVTYLLCGYFMKLVIADRLAFVTNALFDAPGNFDSFFLVMGALLYTIQIYCDFAGYSFISMGCSLLFGIRLTANFHAPYCSKNITEFWRSWHMSLSSWLRDYVYIPLGGNRKGFLRKCINTIIVFVICGMWHGAGFNFLAWGLLHGFYSVADAFSKKFRIKIPFSRTLTFFSVAFAWIFFKASGLKSALFYLYSMLTLGVQKSQFLSFMQTLELNVVETAVIAIGIFLIILCNMISYRKQEPLPELIQHMGNLPRYLIFYLLIILLFIFGIYGPGYHSEQFIYMQF